MTNDEEDRLRNALDRVSEERDRLREALEEARDYASERRSYWDATACDRRQCMRDDNSACAASQEAWNIQDRISEIITRLALKETSDEY